MKPISMTTFIDFVVATPGSKVGEVRKARKLYESDYHPMRDSYGELREAFFTMHREGRPTSSLGAVLAGASDRMRPHWEACIDGYARWVGHKKMVLLPTPKPVKWTSGDLSVRVNPELAVSVNGEPHLIKLYLKAEKISKVRINSMLHLLQQTFPTTTRGTVGILDVRRGKLFTPPVPATIGPLLHGEAAAFVEIWRQLDGPAHITAVS